MPPKVQPTAAVKGKPSTSTLPVASDKSKAGDVHPAASKASGHHDKMESEEEEGTEQEVAPKPKEKSKKDDDDFDDMDDSELQKFVAMEEGGVNPWADLLQEAEKEAVAAATAAEDESGEEYEGDSEEEDEEGEDMSEISSIASEQFQWKEGLSEESLDRDERRYLIDTHSFLYLKDPGLANALILEEKPPEKEYRGLQAEKHDYKKFCDALGVRPVKAFLDHMDGEIMDLRNYALGAKEIIAICKVMCNNTHIKKLLLSGNFAGREGGDAIAEMIENNYTVTHLDIGGTMCLPSMKKICDAIKMNIMLESIDLSMDELTDKEMPYIAGFLLENTTILELFLQHNKITDTGIFHLSKGINTKVKVKKGFLISQKKANETIEKIDLGWNRIKGDKQATVFFESVANHPKIKWINFAGNSLNNARGVGRILGGNLNLEFMDVSYNRMGDKACPFIGKNLAFPKSPNLTNFVAGPNLWRQKVAAQLLLPLSNKKSVVPLETLDMGLGMVVSKKFLKTKRKVWKAKPDLNIIHYAGAYATRKAKGPNPQVVTIRRAKTVCENFATPLEMLIDELRTEPKSMRQDEFKKFIKSCNLYKDKVLTETFFQYFKKGSFEVDCEAIIAVYDQEFPKPKAAAEPKKTSLDLSLELALETDTGELLLQTEPEPQKLPTPTT